MLALPKKFNTEMLFWNKEMLNLTNGVLMNKTKSSNGKSNLKILLTTTVANLLPMMTDMFGPVTSPLEYIWEDKNN